MIVSNYPQLMTYQQFSVICQFSQNSISCLQFVRPSWIQLCVDRQVWIIDSPSCNQEVELCISRQLVNYERLARNMALVPTDYNRYLSHCSHHFGIVPVECGCSVNNLCDPCTRGLAPQTVALVHSLPPLFHQRLSYLIVSDYFVWIFTNKSTLFSHDQQIAQQHFSTFYRMI